MSSVTHFVHSLFLGHFAQALTPVQGERGCPRCVPGTSLGPMRSLGVCNCVCTHACVYICMYECMYVCLSVCMYVCTYVYIQNHTQKNLRTFRWVSCSNSLGVVVFHTLPSANLQGYPHVLYYYNYRHCSYLHQCSNVAGSRRILTTSQHRGVAPCRALLFSTER